jgi:PAS domain S-box-containing protein
MRMNTEDPRSWEKSSAELARSAIESLKVFEKINLESNAICTAIQELARQGKLAPEGFFKQFGELLHHFHSTYVRFLSDLDRIHSRFVDARESISSPARNDASKVSHVADPEVVHVGFNGAYPAYEFSTILDKIPAMIGYWDKDLRNRFANQQYSSWFGLEPKDIVGKHIRDVIGEERFTLNSPYIQAALRGEPQHFERIITDPLGRVRTAMAHYLPDVKAGEVAGFFAIVTDAKPIAV